MGYGFRNTTAEFIDDDFGGIYDDNPYMDSFAITRRRRKTKKSRKHNKRKIRRSHKRRATKRRGLHYTKNGQPYILMKSGKAKFIKRKR